METAPIAFFAYKRPSHTLQALEALSECRLASESILHIFCDGAKRQEDREQVEKVREIVAGRKWCGRVEITARDGNMGLADSVIDGVTSLCNKYGRVIVIEDDLVVAKGFLEYMNHALNLFCDSPRVMQISGHCFPFNHSHGADSAFFMPLSTSWGWGTWQRAWRFFDPCAREYQELNVNGKLRRNFDLGGISPYSRMLLDQMSGRIDSWAIRWWWSFFRNNGLCLYPGKSLVRNIGFGEDATHTTKGEMYHDDPAWTAGREIVTLPDKVEADLKAFEALREYLHAHLAQERCLKKYARLVKTQVLEMPFTIAARTISRLKGFIRRVAPAKPCCVVGDKSVLYPSSQIINALGRKEDIVIGGSCHIRGELFLFGHGGRIRMGDYCYLGFNSRIWSARNIRIGNRVLISHNCNIFDNDTHPLDPEARHRQFVSIITSGHPKEIDLKEKEVIIEDDVLIGANATVLKGVTLGRGSVVGAGSVVTRDVPPYAVVAGNPARIIRELPSDGK